MIEVRLWLEALAWLLGGMTLAWAASVRLRDASLVDRLWSLGFLFCAGYYAVGLSRSSLEPPTSRAILVLTLAAIWGLRLAAFITVRNWGRGEDARYREMREMHEMRARGGSFAWRSLFTVFGLQAVLLWLLGTPLAVAQADRGGSWNGWDVAGGALFLVGFLFEAVGDSQMARFRRDPANRGQVMSRGLWRFTRHPNYFGEATLWWGFACFAIAAGGWWTLYSPLVLTFLLLRVSGVALLERTIVERRPAYRAYIARTSAFLPWFPRRGAEQ